MARLGSSKVPRPVRLKRVTGEQQLRTDLRTVEGRYVLGQELGRGGMGIVRLVKDLDVGRQVAMKTLNPEEPDAAQMVEALIAEAQTTGQLQHPNIVPLYELGVLPGGEVFYTMKAVSGLTFKQVLSDLRNGVEKSKEDYTLRRLLTIFGQVCLAMHYAHTRGVVHRDLKPDNILIGEYGEVLVLDWGIAYVIGKGSQGVLAQPGMVLGTPHYMSPEQARGEIEKVDGRSDVFSLGVILYEILTLNLPISDHDTEQVLEQLRRNEAPVRPTSDDPERPVADVLADVCVKAMDPIQDNRFPDARQLFNRIEKFLEGSEEKDRRNRMAGVELGVGVQAMGQYYEQLKIRERLQGELAARELDVHGWNSQADKRELWNLSARVEQMDLVVSQAFSNAVNHFHRVLGLLPDQRQARAALAKLYLTRLRDAEAISNYADIIYYGDLVLRFNDSEHGGPLKAGNGLITVRSFPEGADLMLMDFKNGVPDTRVATGLSIGSAPVSNYEVPAGMYLMVARKDGYCDDHMPIFVTSGETKAYMMKMQTWASEEKMIGRDGELAVLRYNFERTVQNREMRRVRLSGSAGSGKNRLLNHFIDYLDGLTDAVIFFFAECHEQHAVIPYGAISECLRIRAGITPDDSRASVCKKLEVMMLGRIDRSKKSSSALLELVTSTAETLSSLPGLSVDELETTLEPSELRNRFDQAFIEFLKILTQSSPVIFVFQEIEYLDDASARVISLADRFLSDIPVMILGIGTGGALDQGWDEHIKLTPLSESGVEALLRHILKGAIPPALTEYVYRVTSGVPWHISDVIRRLAEEKNLLLVEGTWRLNQSVLNTKAVSIYEARSRRIRELPPDAYEALRGAAVIGDVFWEDALGALGVEDPSGCCAVLVEKEFIRALSSSRYPETQAYAFRSLLFREIVYDNIRNHEKLSEWHQSVADWIRERQHGDWREIAELAWHSELARDEDWASMLFANLGDICRDVGCVGLARDCYLRAMANTFDMQEREALEARLDEIGSKSNRSGEV